MIPIVVAVVFVIAVAILVSLLVKNRPNTKLSANARTLDKNLINNKWKEIEQTFSLGGSSHLKTSIMDADKLVDYVLKTKGIKGNTLGERLQNSKSIFVNYGDYNNLWFAHKIRNNVAHESMHDLSYAEAKRAMEYFKKALRELGAL